MKTPKGIPIRAMCEHVVEAKVLRLERGRGRLVETGQEVWNAIGSSDLSILLVWYEAACIALGRRHAEDPGYPQYDPNERYVAGDCIVKDGLPHICLRSDDERIFWMKDVGYGKKEFYEAKQGRGL